LKFGENCLIKVNQALNRLNQAVDRLEASVENSSVRIAKSDDSKAKFLAVRIECDELAAVTKEVNNGLDNTINRLKFVLES
jgi:uncharacterized protein YukE